MTTHHDIELYPHNQETYDKIIEAWKTQNRVATIQATGTGKTFLILKCLFTYPDVNKIVLAPSNHILNQLNDKVDELPNTTLLTYTELSFMSKEKIQQMSVSMIMLDEFHRCGAEKWGEGINKLISAFPDAKILGTTATPIRYLDGERDMSDELFDGNVVTNLSLTEAIVKGILPMPKYVSALYTFDEEIMNLKDKIDKSSNSDEEKESFHKEVEQLRKKLDRSKGIPVILKKYLGDSAGKFIVFCRNKSHLMEMQSVVESWFKKAKLGKGIDSYSVYTGKTESENNNTIEEFVSNKNNHNIILLFTIDMLNEGMHVEDVDGVICLRPTTSPIVYYQQIGRALQVGIKEPFVFDFINNFNNLGGNTFGNCLREEAENENKQCKINGKKELDLVDFVIYDEIQDIQRLFGDIETQLRNNWDEMFERYCAGEESEKMKHWVYVQKNNYRNKKLHQERINKLKSVNFLWEIYQYDWKSGYKLMVEYKVKHGHCNVSRTEKGTYEELVLWAECNRRKRREGRLTKEHLDQLNALGFCWIVKTSKWDSHFEQLEKYKFEYGHCNVPIRYEKDGIKLGEWVKTQRRMYNNGKLPQERTDKLNSIDFQWEIGKGKANFTNKNKVSANQNYRIVM